MKIRLSEHAKFGPDRMAKVALASTPRVHVDLYCLEPGQEQKPHTHADQDKIYVVLQGQARADVDGVEESLVPGDMIVARAGVAHGVHNPGPDRLLLLAVIAPPPPHA